MRLLIGVFFAFLAFSTSARDITVNWDLATERVDGTPLPVSEIAVTKIEWGSCVGVDFGTVLGSVDVPAPAVTRVITGLNAGVYCVRGYTVDTDGLISVASNVAQKVLKGKPKPPVLK